MSYFRTRESDDRLRVALVGAGGMGRRWLSLLAESPLADVVGIVDIDAQNARDAASSLNISDVAVDSSIEALLGRIRVEAVINVTVPEAHYEVNRACLLAGVPVLCEKPLVPSLVEAYLLAGLAERTECLLMASQSRRYYAALDKLRRATLETGPPFLLTADFFRDPHFGGFREVMHHPLLIDMAIHAFDAARFLTDQTPVAVRCDSFNPGWSWYDGDAAAVATFEMSDATRFVYTGSWCSGGLATSWNGSWRLSGPRGSTTWDGANSPIVEASEGSATIEATTVDSPSRPEEIAGALHEFVSCLRSGELPSGDVHANVWTLAMVHAAVVSADAGGDRVLISDLLERAFEEAKDSDEVSGAALRAWPDAITPLWVASPASPDRQNKLSSGNP